MIVYKSVRLRSESTGRGFDDHEIYMNHPNDYVLQSLVVLHKDARVTYPVGEWAHTHEWLGVQGYYLTAFAEEHLAITFIKSMHMDATAVVFEAETDVEVPLLSLPRCGVPYYLNPLSKIQIAQYTWPPLTVMAKGLRLTRCVWSKIVYPPLNIAPTEWP